MLVLSREVGYSVSIRGDGSETLLTVLKFDVESNFVVLLVNVAHAEFPGELRSQVIRRSLGDKFRIGGDYIITIVDIVEDKVRLGFEIPRHISVQRFENLENAHPPVDDRDDDGGAVAPVPRPKEPKPPTLDVRIDLPKGDNDE